MTRKPVIQYAVVALALSVLFAWTPTGLALTAQGYSKADQTRGGLLYDNWPKLLGFSTTTNHPLYPPDGKKRATATWRCKECHGWDYRGNEGRYRAGSHYTGIAGVWTARNKSPERIYEALSNAKGSHDFGAHLSEADLWALVRFLREGTMDTSGVFRTDDTVAGNPERGQPLYRTQCARCHGDDGDRLDFDDEKAGPQGIGWISRDNPQETLHKIRWGHPGTGMPSAVAQGLSDSDTVDLLSYARTRP